MKGEALLLLGLHARDVTSRRELHDFLQIVHLNISRASILITIVHTLKDLFEKDILTLYLPKDDIFSLKDKMVRVLIC